MESVTIEIRESERCPAGLEVLLNQPNFTINLNPKGGVGDFEIINSKGEVLLIGQKHLATISLLENNSRSEVLTLDLSDLSEMTISCPPSEDIATIKNTNMGLCNPNTIEITTKGGGGGQEVKQFNFKFQKAISSSPLSKNDDGDDNDQQLGKQVYNFQVLNSGSILVAELCVSRLSSKAEVNLPGHVPLTPVQAAVIFGGIAFQIYSYKKQKSVLALMTAGGVIGLILLIILAYLLIN